MKIAALFLALLAFCAITTYAQDDNCTYCEYVAQLVEYGIELEGLNSTEIEAYVEQACALLPSLQSECDAIVALYLDKIIEELSDGASPQQVCTDIGLCSSVKYQKVAMKPKAPFRV